ncbi:MAG: hypothetical protein JWM20_729 [Patescibacteria group bacterium]|nr:hypothetical protein [Patescibacteria group bacterium]
MTKKKYALILNMVAYYPINISTKPMARKYSKGAQKKVKKVMDEWKSGKLKSGRSGKKVTSQKQAVAIGLSEARKAGKKVPKKRSSKKSSKKANK